MATDSTRTYATPPTASRSRLAEPSLWDFALAFYAKPGVEDACLHLQDDANVDVCELIWRCWLYQHGLVASAEPAGLEEIRRWQHEVTVPLRELRRTLKDSARDQPGVADIRRYLKRAELAAERETLSRLQALVEQEEALFILAEASSGLEKSLGNMLQLQKKSHFLALQTLESRLDPLPAAR